MVILTIEIRVIWISHTFLVFVYLSIYHFPYFLADEQKIQKVREIQITQICYIVYTLINLKRYKELKSRLGIFFRILLSFPC